MKKIHASNKNPYIVQAPYWNLQQSINMHKENIKHIKAAEKGKPAEEPTSIEG